MRSNSSGENTRTNLNKEMRRNMREQNSTRNALIETAKKLTLNSNFEKFRNRLYTLKRKEDKTAVLSAVKQHAQNMKQASLWEKMQGVLNKNGGKRNTRKNNAMMRRTRKNRR